MKNASKCISVTHYDGIYMHNTYIDEICQVHRSVPYYSGGVIFLEIHSRKCEKLIVLI